MKVPFVAAALGLLLASSAWPQQANVNLDWNPQKNTENLVVTSAGALEVLDAHFAWRRTPEGDAWPN